MKRTQAQPPRGLSGGQYQPLTDGEILRIHRASLAILERTGVQVEEPEGTSPLVSKSDLFTSYP